MQFRIDLLPGRNEGRVARQSEDQSFHLEGDAGAAGWRPDVSPEPVVVSAVDAEVSLQLILHGTETVRDRHFGGRDVGVGGEVGFGSSRGTRSNLHRTCVYCEGAVHELPPTLGRVRLFKEIEELYSRRR